MGNDRPAKSIARQNTMTEIQYTPDQFKVLLDWPVQWGDQDLLGHVNHTIYFRWFESARVAYLDRLGPALPYNRGEVGPILAAINCNFRRQVGYPDTVRIGARVSRIGRTSVTMDYGLWSSGQGNSLVADGSSVVVVFDYRTQKPTPVTDEIRAAISKLEERKV